MIARGDGPLAGHKQITREFKLTDTAVEGTHRAVGGAEGNAFERDGRSGTQHANYWVNCFVLLYYFVSISRQLENHTK